MKYLNCYILKTEVVNIYGDSEGELSQYLLQIEEYNDNKKLEESTFLYLNDNVDNLEIMIPKVLQDNDLITKEETIIDINNSSMVIEFDGQYYTVIE